MIVLTKFSIACYRFFRKIAICDYSILFASPLIEIESLENRDGISFHCLSTDQWGELSACNDQFRASEFLSLDPARFQCWGLKENNQWIAYLWTGVGAILAEHNSNGHPWTGLPLQLDDRAVYLFAAFVQPAKRGRRFYQYLLGKVALALRTRGFDIAVLTADVTNIPANRTVRRLGFKAYASTRFTRLRKWASASYSCKELPGYCHIGVYHGECA
jgi:ribosomal protein S18 acetylase RimI-like enzyme